MFDIMKNFLCSEKFLTFIEIWRKDFGIERTIDEKVCLDRDGRPLPWYTYPAIEYLSQFDYSQKRIFEFGCGYSSLFLAERAEKVVSIEDNPQWFEKWQREFNRPNLDVRQRDDGEEYCRAVAEDGEVYDVIVIDGKRRADCARYAIERLNEGGLIILDDSDRVNTSQEYKNAVAILRDQNIQIIKDSKLSSNDISSLILVGHSGNSKIAYFNDLHKLSLKDNIYIYYNRHKYIYELTTIYDIPKTGYFYPENSSQHIITLITCKNNSKDLQAVYVGKLIKKLRVSKTDT